MTVTQHLMRPGTGNIRFTSGFPVSKSSAIFDLINEDTTDGVGAHIVLTPVRVDPDAIGDAAVLAAASYTGRITKRPSRLSLEFVGLGSWLDTYIDAEVTRTSGTLANWLTDLLTNDLSQGTVGTATAVTKTFPPYIATHREALDAVMGLAGAEYRIMPDFTVDADDAATLFVSPPTVVVTRKAEGPDGAYRGVDGGMLDQALDVSRIATKAVALAEGAGSSIAVGSDTTTTNLNAPKGTAPDLVKVLSAPGEESGNAGTLATNYLNLQSQRRQVSVTSTTHHLPRFVVPGDEVYLYDPASGLVDTSNQIQFRGETITPALVRLLSYTWPIEQGGGVYIRSNEATAVYHDVTDWVEWESGDTWWTVGNWNPPSYGRVNRSDPEVEERVSETGPARILLTRATAMSIANAGSGTTITWGTSESYLTETPVEFKAAAADIITIPTGLGGDYLVTFSGEFAADTTGVRQVAVVIGANTGEPNELGILRHKANAAGGFVDGLSVSGVVRLAVGATLTASAYQNSGGALDLTDMRFSAVRLGP